jgi:hypothetical protein
MVQTTVLLAGLPPPPVVGGAGKHVLLNMLRGRRPFLLLEPFEPEKEYYLVCQSVLLAYTPPPHLTTTQPSTTASERQDCTRVLK